MTSWARGTRRMAILAGALVQAALLGGLSPGAATAQTVEPPFDASYTVTDLGSPPMVPSPLGGLTLAAGDNDTLLIGGAANTADGALYSVAVTRDAGGHITGFSGTATRYADAAYNDGGVTYGPGGVLFLARWPVNELGQTRPGSAITDKIIDMAGLGVASSLSALAFVPAGFPGGGSVKLSSWSGGQWYDAAVTPDASGTYDVVGVTPVPASDLPGGPEGYVYVPLGSSQFAGPSMLVSEYSAGTVAAYELDSDGNPTVATRRTFIGGLAGAEGAFIDPVTNDFLFSTFGGGDRVIAVRGFATPPPAPAVTLVTPAHGSSTNDPTPLFSGTAGVAADDSQTVTVRVHAGPAVTRTPVLTLTATRSGANWSVSPAEALPDGQYTAVASQANAAGNVGTSGANTFTIDTRVTPAPTQPGQAVGGVSQVPPPPVGDRDGDGIPDNVDTSDGSLPPEPGKSVNVRVVSGTVTIQYPRGYSGPRAWAAQAGGFVPLKGAAHIPVGSTLNTAKGRVALTSAADRRSKVQTADFYAGIFQVKQAVPRALPRAASLTTDIVLKGRSEKAICGPSKGTGRAAQSKKRPGKTVLGQLWGNGKGKFRTRGKHSAATVRGTVWLTADRCDGTLTKVVRGSVRVRDFRLARTVTVRAGQSYLARAQRAASKVSRPR